MIDIKNIRGFHIELSSKCNAACPMCSRNFLGSFTIPFVKESSWTIENFKKVFTKRWIRYLKHFTFCGNLGDPLMCDDLTPIVKYIMDNNKHFEISINTNGGARSKDWWFKLGNQMSRNPLNYVIFSVDGLEDTNHIYRRKVKWSNVINAMKGYVEGGGRAIWEFLVFKHNEHQIEDVKKLADEIGINELVFKRPMGFGSGTGQVALTPDVDVDYEIFPSTIEEYQNEDVRGKEIKSTLDSWKFLDNSVEKSKFLSKWKSIEKRDNFFETIHYPNEFEYLDNVDFSCRVSDEKTEVFIDSLGNLFPCCFTASKFYQNSDYVSEELRNFIIEYDMKNLNVHEKDLRLIIESEFFQKLFLQKRLYVCKLFCGDQKTLDSINYYTGSNDE
jgi:MoaA/NifB/PqqE/SkfB family radical SAM enzyme